MGRFDKNFIQVNEFNGKKYVIFQYADNTWGVMIREKYAVEKIPRRFINDDLARECVEECVGVAKIKKELKDANIEQLSFF